jgi:hypothetical protein
MSDPFLSIEWLRDNELLASILAGVTLWSSILLPDSWLRFGLGLCLGISIAGIVGPTGYLFLGLVGFTILGPRAGIKRRP